MLRCPECNSEKLIKFGFKWAGSKVDIGDGEKKKRIKLQQYQCKDCGRLTTAPVYFKDK